MCFQAGSFHQGIHEHLSDFVIQSFIEKFLISPIVLPVTFPNLDTSDGKSPRFFPFKSETNLSIMALKQVYHLAFLSLQAILSH